MAHIKDFILENLISLFFLGIFGVVITRIIGREKHHKNAKKILEKAIQTNLNEPLTLHPEIDPKLCAGCATCTQVCPEGDILKMINHKAVLVSPTKCVGHGECEKACPMGAITLVFGTKTRGMDIPRLSTNYETNVSGLYIAGELGGMGLIRNAIKQGVLAAQHALNQKMSVGADYDLIIVGGGPAGLAASLVAIAQKKKYLCLEQNTFGGTVYNFPRQKLVMSQPFALPILGKKQFSSNQVSKEDLLSYWNDVRRQTGLKIQEGTRFQSVKKEGDHFVVETSKGTFQASKVILAMGVRGSPRKLGVPGEGSEKVTYNLIDAEQYQAKNVIVVGGGNAALEAAQMLAKAQYRNKVHLFVRGLALERSNEENIRRLKNLEQQGLVTVMYQTSIQEIKIDEVIYKKNDEILKMKNDYIFVFAGTELPHKFLMSLGVQIDKKFGEGLGSV